MPTDWTASPHDEAWRRIKGLKPVVQQHHHDGDHLRRLPTPIADAFLAADVYRMCIPADLGGAGLDPLTLFDLVEELSSYDGSTGWNFAIGAGGFIVLGSLPLPRLQSLFDGPHCNLAGSSAPTGRAVAVEGGYLLSGRWAWASGIHQSRFVGGGALIHDGDTPRRNANGSLCPIFCLVPKERINILDTWKTGGMRGTGSTEWEAENIFIPDSDVCHFLAGRSAHHSPMFRLPATFAGLTLCAVALGVTRSAIEGLRVLAAENKSNWRDQTAAQYAIAKAQALHESAQLYVREAFRPIWANTVDDLPQNVDDKARARRAYVHAVEAAIGAVTLCHDAAGGAAAFEARPFAKALRDVHAVRAHAVLSRRFMEMAGQAAFGMAVANPLF